MKQVLEFTVLSVVKYQQVEYSVLIDNRETSLNMVNILRREWERIDGRLKQF